MRRYSFSIRGLMAVIVIVAVALVALRTPSRIGASLWFSVALGGVTLSIPAAVATIGERRAFWVGFAVSGGVYFLFALAPWVDERASHQLLSTALLDMASPYLIKNDYLIQSYTYMMNPPSPPDAPTLWQVWNLPDFQTAANKNWISGYATLHSPFLYLRIGHAVFCLLCGITGGEVARFLYLRRPPAHTPRTNP